MRAIKAARDSRPGSPMSTSSSLHSLHSSPRATVKDRLDFRLGYHQTSWDSGQTILRAGFPNKDRVGGKTAMLGPGVYFASTPEDTCGKAQHGQPNAMMLECYVHVGSMDVAKSTEEFRNATRADSVYWRGFSGRPEFVVKDNREIYIVSAYACDPRTGKPLGPIDDAAREARLRYATTVWQEERLVDEEKFKFELVQFNRALEHFGNSKKTTHHKMCTEDREQLTNIFHRFAGPNDCLNHAELYALLSAIGQVPMNNGGDLVATFRQFDRNMNGSLSLPEFLREMKVRAKHRARKRKGLRS
mmetsp:Transcript_157465/g.277792  ORF Transcript_157465/g.277792 Transcript_157465/m.277792 type:complete len:302 (-) Transcript_157465:114-1019(-)